jgi:antitoxin (DNA-binding transcriptional repressor) of toxin-antitoxin stability system
MYFRTKRSGGFEYLQMVESHRVNGKPRQTVLATLGRNLVERGEKVAITRHGKEVARLVPPKGVVSREAARAAAEGIRAMRKGVTLGGLKIKDLINDGRR